VTPRWWTRLHASRLIRRAETRSASASTQVGAPLPLDWLRTPVPLSVADVKQLEARWREALAKPVKITALHLPAVSTPALTEDVAVDSDGEPFAHRVTVGPTSITLTLADAAALDGDPEREAKLRAMVRASEDWVRYGPPPLRVEVADLIEQARDAIVANPPDWPRLGIQPANGWPTTTGSIAVPLDLDAVIREMTGVVHTARRPRAARIELGDHAERMLRSAARIEPDDAPRWAADNVVIRMYGVPVVVDDRLNPGRWRILDHDGHVISEGDVGPPVIDWEATLAAGDLAHADAHDPATCPHNLWLDVTGLDTADRTEMCRDCGTHRDVPR